MRGLAAAWLMLGAWVCAAAVVVDEAGVRAEQRNGATVVIVPVRSDLGREVGATVTLAWVDTSERLDGRVERKLRIGPGETRVEVPMGLEDASIWTRLRYRLEPERADAIFFGRTEGTLALARIADFVFEARASVVGVVRRGALLTVHAQAVHPVTRRAVDGVKWSGEPAGKVRNLGGGAVAFEVKLPEAGEDEGQVELTAKRGDFEQEVRVDFRASARMAARIQTDKPIYQPGQTVHMRAVVTDARGRAAAGAKVTLRVEDEANERLLTKELTASRFGVVSADYALPETADLGQYTVELVAEGDDDYRLAQHAVRVSRYELPAFSVTARAERGAYLPGERAAVEVAGQYLFGKPVAKGAVKIVRAGVRRWDREKKMYVSEEDVVREGVAGADGKWRVELELPGYEGDGKFEDLHFAAYVRDPVSGRTEQRRFDVRVSKEPVHVYFRSGYVSTYLADGRPVKTKVEARVGTRVTVVETNRYGVARLAVGEGETASLRAVDADGHVGTGQGWPSQYGARNARLETGRTMYRAGEAVTLRWAGRAGPVVVHAVADGQRVATRVMERGEVTFPYQPEFRRTVMFAAVENGLAAARAVVFPDGADLQVSVAGERAEYKPGEAGALLLKVVDAARRPVEAALGVAVVDQAVMERARTDGEFGERGWFGCAFCAGSDEVEMGGVRLADLYHFQGVAGAELDLVAEALVAGTEAVVVAQASEDWGTLPGFGSITTQRGLLERRLEETYARTLDFPREGTGLALGTDFLDPWGMDYRVEFGVRGDGFTVALRSAGPDKRMDTDDDFVAMEFRKSYFLPLRKLMAGALEKEDDYPGTEGELAEVLRRNGLLLEGLRDPWGTAYFGRVATYGSRRQVEVLSAGPDRKAGTADDVTVGSFWGLYFRKETARIDAAVREAAKAPQTREEFLALVAGAGIDVGSYRDGWGQAYRVTSAVRSEYRDRTNTKTVQEFGQAARAVTEVTPVTQKLMTFSIRSNGPDKAEGTYDDFDVAHFSVVLETTQAETVPARAGAPLRGTGVIAGVVTDPTGAVVPGATVVLLDAAMRSYETRSGKDGSFHFLSVPAGMYSVRVMMAGFQAFELLRVPVTDGRTTNLTAVLQVGSVSQAVMVTAENVELMTSESSVAAAAAATGTPRVREYFPETLLWLPEVTTDKGGRVRVPVQLADSITNWKVAVFASTADGRWAEGAGDVRVFQPLFLDFAPPAVLTEGDRVEVPVTVRNYTERGQKVGVRMEAGDWARVEGAREKTAEVEANGSVSLTYPLTAARWRERAGMRVVSRADAVEKRLRVEPDGQLTTQTEGALGTAETAMTVTIPAAAIGGATRGELRLYPNFASLLLEAAEGIVVTPHGCAEQTASAGYANLIAWRYALSTGVRDKRVEASALANIRLAVEGLRAYTGRDGGVRYWSSGEANIAVTAHVLQFLVEAAAYVPVDAEQLGRTAAWLAQQQGKDGMWAGGMLTSGVAARALAAVQKAGIAVPEGALASAYYPLSQRVSGAEEPYWLAQYVMAVLDSGDEKLLGDAVARLAAMGRRERDGIYWDLQTNSPYYGWGRAGRLETTGHVVSALAAWRRRHPEAKEVDAAMRGGLLFLVRNRDAWGGWYSTQATVRAMRAVVDYAGVFGGLAASGEAAVRVNGRAVRTVALKGVDAVVVDVSAYLGAGENRVEVAGAGGALLRLTARHWTPWGVAALRRDGALRFGVDFDRAEAGMGELVRCSVKAERVGFRGYGMMLAEVGLAPGMEVDRASLEGAPVDRYEVLPDRVVFYLWPRAGGVSFDFFVRARMRMRAKTGASVLFDYYNPEARTEVAPVGVVVR